MTFWSPKSDLEFEERLNKDKRLSIDEFAKRVKDIDYEYCRSRRYLSRWLQARDWDLNNAESMLRSHIAWRRENKIDDILQQYNVPEVVANYFPGGFCGVDNDDLPVYVVPVGRLDTIGLLKLVTPEEFKWSRVYYVEYIIHHILRDISKRLNRCIDQVCILLDMKGLNWKHISPSWVPLCSEVLTLLEANYPEFMNICYIINTPSIFGTVYNAFKPFLSKSTQDKIFILGSDYKEKLVQLFQPECLPACYGGKLTDPNGDPRCQTHICWGGLIPTSYFSQQRHNDESCGCATTSNRSNFFKDGKLSKPIVIGPASREDIYIGYATCRDIIRWSVAVENHDIAFTILLKRSESSFSYSTKNDVPNGTVCSAPEETFEDTHEVLSVKRVASNHVVHDQLVVRESGIYILRLDNTCSWVRTKCVWYHVDLISQLSKVGDVQLHSKVCQSQVSHCELMNKFEITQFTPFTESHIISIPKEGLTKCRLETGGNMDVNVSLLFRLLAQLILVPKLAQFDRSL